MKSNVQAALWAENYGGEDPDYLTKQIITYIGNKRALLPYIGHSLENVKKRLNKFRLKTLDIFSGSGIVSRYFKGHSELLISNDFESYAAAIGRCYLTNKGTVDRRKLAAILDKINRDVDKAVLPRGFIEEYYSPRYENRITKEDRVFYTPENAKRIDNYRRLIEELEEDCRKLLLGPLLSEASVHANTAGVFKGFYKDRRTGIGKFGGTKGDALTRILGKIVLKMPVLSRFECDVLVTERDANELAKEIRNLDLVYVDPPYNEHPYGSNYFMLNLITEYERPKKISRVSGIPNDWRRSGYNSRKLARYLFKDLLESIDAPFLLISFNDEGFISEREITDILSGLGNFETTEIKYNTFRGSRNLRGRAVHVKEFLFLVERG